MDTQASNNFTPDRFLNSYSNWQEQIKRSLKTKEDFSKVLNLTAKEEQGFDQGKDIFNIQATPYYVSLINKDNPDDPIRRMILPHAEEIENLNTTELDPLGEKKNSPVDRIVHRYKDRVLFLATDFCGIYCRYCTRKHFTGQNQVFPKKSDYQEALDYIRSHSEIKEVILSGGDPLTLSNSKLETILKDLESIPHVELIRVGSRMPAACPMRLDEDLLKVLKRDKPVYLMTHFNHPQELSELAKKHLLNFTTSGVPVYNQMVLLNGINNHEALVYKLSRELLKLRVHPYYMFQCDPSHGTDHLKTSVQESLDIQKKLWGKASGLSMPTYSVDIPSGGGKTYLNPNAIVEMTDEKIHFKGFDGVEADYHNRKSSKREPYIDEEILDFWNNLN